MGEYITYRGEQHKLGTCESLYYVRHSSLLELQKQGISEADYFLDEENGYRFRFPFPEEDALFAANPLPHIDDFSKGFALTVPKNSVLTEHSLMTLVLPNSHPHFNMPVPCAQDDEKFGAFDALLRHKRSLDRTYLHIVQERYINGLPWTVFRCPYCNTEFRCDASEIQVIKSELSKSIEYSAKHGDEYHAAYLQTISDRIYGYNPE